MILIRHSDSENRRVWGLKQNGDHRRETELLNVSYNKFITVERRPAAAFTEVTLLSSSTKLCFIFSKGWNPFLVSNISRIPANLTSNTLL